LKAEQGDSLLDVKKVDPKLGNPLGRDLGIDLKVESLDILSEGPKTPLNVFPNSEQYNLPFDPNTAQNEINFVTLGKISERCR